MTIYSHYHLNFSIATNSHQNHVHVIENEQNSEILFLKENEILF